MPKMKPNLRNLNEHAHTKKLYESHPVYKRTKREQLIQSEIERLEKSLKDLPDFERIVELVNQPNISNMQKCILLGKIAFSKDRQLSSLEKKLSPKQKKELINIGLDTIAEILGVPKEFVHNLHTKQNWKSLEDSMPEFIDANQPKSKHLSTLDSLPKEQRKKLLDLINKRILHNSVIQGNGLRLFTQGLQLFADKIDKMQPGLAKEYRHFSSLAQLSNVFLELEDIPPTKPRIAEVKPEIKNNSFSFETTGPTFPVLFQEIAKGTYEALMHSGMPTKKELGKHEDLFHNLTTNDSYEFEHFKTSPEISKRFHSFLSKNILDSKSRDLLKSVLRRKYGYMDNIPDSYLVTMAYKAFSKFSPRDTFVFMNRIVNSEMDSRLKKIFINKIAKNL